MQTDSKNKIYTVEEYIGHELKSDVRSEFINGQLFEMPEEKDINNEIAGTLYVLFVSLLKPPGYFIYNHDVEVRIFGENQYYYPDVFITREPKTDSNKYIKSEPVLIAKVLSELTHITDQVDKYIAYTKIPSLQYYLMIEPNITLITCYIRGENGEWITSKFTHADDVINLTNIDCAFQLKQVYA